MSEVFSDYAGPRTEGELESYGYGSGFFEILQVANPAAGSEATLTTAQNAVSRLVSVAFLLTTTAVVASRQVTIEYQDGNGNVWLRAGAAVNVLASSTQEFTAYIGGGSGAWNTGTPVFFGLPDRFLEPGRVVVIDVDAIDVGDTLTQIFVGWERFPTGPRGFPVGRVGPGGRHVQHPRPGHIARR